MISKRHIDLCKVILFKNIKSYSTRGPRTITCKNKEFDFYGERSGRNDEILLASKGWGHKFSRGDYFIVHANESSVMSNVVMKNKSFAECGLDENIVQALVNQKITNPTDIQCKSIPLLLSRQNALITAETGCGKTLAYLLPIIQQLIHLKHIPRGFNSPLAVILTPSRELADQISIVAKNLCKELNLDVKSLVGGRTKKMMLNPSFQGVDILVASLGAFSKLVTTGVYKIKDIRHVVLDEADSLLDDSFIEKVSHLMCKMKFHYHATETEGTQLTLVSATMPKELPETVVKFIDPDSIKKVSSDQLHKILPHVPQRFLRLGPSQKPLELLKLIRADENKRNPVMIFSNRTPTCNWISMFLNENGIKCIDINGKLPSMIKAAQFASYANADVNVIACTDIASRGLDTLRTKHVINYDFPLYTADYIHRCGRTGRLGSSSDCHVTNFVSSQREIQLVQKIEMSVRQMVDLPNVNANISRIINDRIQKEIDATEKEVHDLRAKA